MLRIVIIHDPVSRHAETWRSWLESDGLKVDMLNDKASFDQQKNERYDLVIPLITIKDYVDRTNIRMQALAHFKASGTRLLTSPEAIAISSDKFRTAKTMRARGLPHPRTIEATQLEWSRAQTPIVMKPRFGHSGNGIRLVRGEQEFKKYSDADMLAQNFIADATCIRIIASQSHVLSAYKKIPPPGEVIANVDNGAKRLSLQPSDEMRQLALSTAKAMGGGLMGVDLLDSPGGLYVLEANVPFGFDPKDQDFRRKLVAYIKEIAG